MPFIVPEQTKNIVERFGSSGVEGVDSLDALLASGVDGVIIAAGTDAHTDVVLACVEAGLPTPCEKPVAQNGAQGADLLRRLRGSTVPVQIGFQRRYDAAIAAAKAAVDSGELGWITTIRSTTLDPEPPPPEYVAVSGEMYRDCGVHDFDIIRWVTGQENVLHMHRLRALCDAIVVGAGTVAADDPQLTTRLVTGANPLRVVLDPARRLTDRHRVFTDDEAETWYVCARSLTPAVVFS